MPYTPGQILNGKRVDLGDVQLGTVDDAGVAWRIGTEGLQGWDGAEVRTQITEREADHGAWMGPVYASERVITLAGTITAPDARSLDAAVEQLLAACSYSDTTVTVWETIPKQATVRRSGKPVIQPTTDRIATYSLMVTAADPRRYQVGQQSGTVGLPSISGGLAPPLTPPLTVGASVTSGEIFAANAGSMTTRPTFTVIGPVQQPSITVVAPTATTTLHYNDILSDGDVLVIDTDAHTVTLNGTASRRRYLSGQWPEIPAGASVSIEFRAAFYNVNSMLTATWRSAWI